MAYRVDLRGSVRKSEKTPQGGLRVDAGLTRGNAVFEYAQANGNVVREYRPLGEVSRADSLATLRSAPVTLGHPPGKVTRANYRKYAVGQLEGEARMDGDTVAAELVVQADDALQAVESRKAREISCGYECDIDVTAGVTEAGERYDVVQRNIRYNHVAIVAQGRAGSSVCLRLDSNNDTFIETSPESVSESMEPEMTAEQIAKLQSDLAAATVRADAAELASKNEKARADKAEGERDVLASRADAAEGALKLRVDAEELARVVAIATKTVKGFKADTKTTSEVKAEIIASRFPQLKLDGKGAEYIDALVDGAATSDRADNAAESRVAVRADAKPNMPETCDAETRRAEMIKRNREAYKQAASK